MPPVGLPCKGADNSGSEQALPSHLSYPQPSWLFRCYRLTRFNPHRISGPESLWVRSVAQSQDPERSPWLYSACSQHSCSCFVFPSDSQPHMKSKALWSFTMLPSESCPPQLETNVIVKLSSSASQLLGRVCRAMASHTRLNPVFW